MELLPIVVAAHLWGASWSRLQVQFLCDNRSVVDALTAGTARSPPSHASASQPHTGSLFK
jgi:hypothetical protein